MSCAAAQRQSASQTRAHRTTGRAGGRRARDIFTAAARCCGERAGARTAQPAPCEVQAVRPAAQAERNACKCRHAAEPHLDAHPGRWILQGAVCRAAQPGDARLRPDPQLAALEAQHLALDPSRLCVVHPDQASSGVVLHFHLGQRPASQQRRLPGPPQARAHAMPARPRLRLSAGGLLVARTLALLARRTPQLPESLCAALRYRFLLTKQAQSQQSGEQGRKAVLRSPAAAGAGKVSCPVPV